MYDPDELIQEFKTYTPLEKAALEYGETDSSLIAEQLGIIDYQLDQSMRKTLSKEYYFPTGNGITYSKHPRFLSGPPPRLFRTHLCLAGKCPSDSKQFYH